MLDGPAEGQLLDRPNSRARRRWRVSGPALRAIAQPTVAASNSTRSDREEPAVASSLTTPGILDDRPPRWCPRLLDRSQHDASITSTMLAVKIDRDRPVLLHDQVAGEIRRAIAEGEAAPGERLPPARDLAAVLQVNTNTVAAGATTAARRRAPGVPPRSRRPRRRHPPARCRARQGQRVRAVRTSIRL